MKNNLTTPSLCSECDSRKDALFFELSPDELLEVSCNKKNRIYKKGQIIFYEGDRPMGLFCIYKGKVKVFKTGNEGKEQIVRFAKTGEVLGYRALLGGEMYSASATALEDSAICQVTKECFFKIMENNNKIFLKAVNKLTDDLKQSERKIVNMAQKPVRERVAEALLVLKEYFGTLNGSNMINATLSRKEIGDLAGTTPETTIRILSEFNTEKTIKLVGKKIQILDMPVLVRTANIYD